MPGYVDGFASRAMFNEPCGVMCGEHGEVYVCDGANRRIRVIVDGSSVTTVAGCGERGVLDNEPLSASFCRPVSCSLDRTGKTETVLCAYLRFVTWSCLYNECRGYSNL